VAAESIGPDGRQVRCANCSYMWFQDPPPPPEPSFEAAPEAAQEEMPDFSKYDIPLESPEPRLRSIPKGSNLPAVIEEKTANTGLKIAFFILLFLALMTAGSVFHKSIIRLLPFSEPIYKLSGMYVSDGLSLTDVTVKRSKTIGTPRYTITCKIINLSDQKRMVPALYVSLIDGSGSVIASKKQHLDDTKLLEPQESIACDTLQIELVHASKDTKKVRLDIGSPYDVMLRD